MGGNYACPEQHFRSCVDIKIIANPADKAIYASNPVVHVPSNYPQTFMCPWHNWKQSNLQNSLPDPYQYQTNASVYCFVINDQWDGFDLNKCDTCRINCMTPGKTCPSGCNCRWFPRNQNTFYVPMDPEKPLNKFIR